jgi:hypothetical protein
MSGGAWKDYGLIQDFYLHQINQERKFRERSAEEEEQRPEEIL